MLGSIEDLEKDIELFQQNVAASGEMTKLLQQMVEQIKVQNAEFDSQSKALVSRMDVLPGNIENANASNNLKIKSDVASEFERCLLNFTTEQNKYLQGLEQVKLQIQTYIEQSKSQERTFADKTTTIVTKVDGIPGAIEAENAKSNAQIKNDVASEMESAVRKFADEQSKYITAMTDTREKINSMVEQLRQQEDTSSSRINTLLDKVDSALNQMVSNLEAANDKLKKEVEQIIDDRNAQFLKDQADYVTEAQQTQKNIKACEEQLNAKYKEFVDTLEKMNISNLYDQNVELKKELNKRTTILMVISILSVIAGVVGILL